MSRLSSRSRWLTSGAATASDTPRTIAVSQVTRRIPASITDTSPGVEEMRRAAVACRASWATLTTISRFITAANAPYWSGPSARAAMIVKPYVATFMAPIATAMTPPLVTACLDVASGTPGVFHSA